MPLGPGPLPTAASARPAARQTRRPRAGRAVRDLTIAEEVGLNRNDEAATTMDRCLEGAWT